MHLQVMIVPSTSVLLALFYGFTLQYVQPFNALTIVSSQLHSCDRCSGRLTRSSWLMTALTATPFSKQLLPPSSAPSSQATSCNLPLTSFSSPLCCVCFAAVLQPLPFHFHAISERPLFHTRARRNEQVIVVFSTHYSCNRNSS